MGEAIEHAERQASDADRDRAAAVLRVAAGRGAIDIEELDQRLGDVFRARTIGQLASVTWDLDHAPAPTTAPASGLAHHRVWRDGGFRAHAAAYVLTNGFLTGIYLVTTPFGFPWPFFPAGGWGIGLGMHAFSANERERKQAERQVLRVTKARTDAAVAAPARVPLPPAPVSPKRFVVAMFTDIAGSTRLNEALGDAEWMRVRTHHRALLQQCFSAAGGFEVNAIGDGFLARFDSPSSAVGCAVEIQRRLDTQRNENGFAPAVRIGIHSGDAVEDGTDIIGAVVNLASRVTSAADAGEIVITEPVADQLGDRHGIHDRGLVQLKGVNQARHLLAVDWR